MGKLYNGYARAILIDPESRTVLEVYLNPNLQGLYYPLKHADAHFSGTIDAVQVAQNETLYVDDEGCLNPGRAAFRIGERLFAGAALLIGVDDDGETCSTRLPLALVKNAVSWTDLETTGDFEESRETVTNHPILGPNTPTYIGGQPIYRERPRHDGGAA